MPALSKKVVAIPAATAIRKVSAFFFSPAIAKAPATEIVTKISAVLLPNAVISRSASSFQADTLPASLITLNNALSNVVSTPM